MKLLSGNAFLLKFNKSGLMMASVGSVINVYEGGSNLNKDNHLISNATYQSVRTSDSKWKP